MIYNYLQITLFIYISRCDENNYNLNKFDGVQKFNFGNSAISAIPSDLPNMIKLEDISSIGTSVKYLDRNMDSQFSSDENISYDFGLFIYNQSI